MKLSGKVAAVLLACSPSLACPGPVTTRASYYGPGFNGQRTASGRAACLASF